MVVLGTNEHPSSLYVSTYLLLWISHAHLILLK